MNYITFSFGCLGAPALSLYLDSCPETYCVGEIFSRDYLKQDIGEEDIRTLGKRIKDIRDNPGDYLEDVFSSYRINNIGVEISEFDLKHDNTKALFSSELDVKYIFLKRKNLTMSYIEKVYESIDIYSLHPFEVNLKKLKKQVQYEKWATSQYSSMLSNKDCHEVFYEDLFDLDNQVFNSDELNLIVDFLGIESADESNIGFDFPNITDFSWIANLDKINEEFGDNYGSLI